MSAIPSWCRVGAKVVCVGNHQSWEWTRRPSLVDRFRQKLCGDPKVGKIYTVVSTLIEDGYPCLRLKGFHPAYVIRSFRPVVSQSDDITTHFKALLNVHAPVELVEV